MANTEQSAALEQEVRSSIKELIDGYKSTPVDQQDPGLFRRDAREILAAENALAALRVHDELRPLVQQLFNTNPNHLTRNIMVGMICVELRISPPAEISSSGGADSTLRLSDDDGPSVGAADDTNDTESPPGSQTLEERLMKRVDDRLASTLSQFLADFSAKTATSSTGRSGIDEGASIREKISERRRASVTGRGTRSKGSPGTGSTFVAALRTSKGVDALADTADNEDFDGEVWIGPPPHLADNRGKIPLQVEDGELHVGYEFYLSTCNSYNGSLSAWARTKRWSNSRNGREAITLARGLDMAVGQGLSLREWAFAEVFLRRLISIAAADRDGNWEVARRYEEDGCQLGIVIPERMRARALKTASQSARLEQKAKLKKKKRPGKGEKAQQQSSSSDEE